MRTLYKKDKSNKWKEKFGDQSQQQRKEFEAKQAIGEGAVPAAGHTKNIIDAGESLLTRNQTNLA